MNSSGGSGDEENHENKESQEQHCSDEGTSNSQNVKQDEEKESGVVSSYVYRDLSHIQPNTRYLSSEIWDSSHYVVQRLPAKLNAMLSDQTLSSVVTWMPHGRSWKIIDRKLFKQVALPKYFEHSNIESFFRLVNAWGFRRVPSGMDRNSFYHELFLRGMPHLRARMKRLSKHVAKAPVDFCDRCPNFYDMPSLPENDPESQTKESNRLGPGGVTNNSKVEIKKRPSSKVESSDQQSASAVSQKIDNDDHCASNNDGVQQADSPSPSPASLHNPPVLKSNPNENSEQQSFSIDSNDQHQEENEAQNFNNQDTECRAPLVQPQQSPEIISPNQTAPQINVCLSPNNLYAPPILAQWPNSTIGSLPINSYSLNHIATNNAQQQQTLSLLALLGQQPSIPNSLELQIANALLHQRSNVPSYQTYSPTISALASHSIPSNVSAATLLQNMQSSALPGFSAGYPTSNIHAQIESMAMNPQTSAQLASILSSLSQNERLQPSPHQASSQLASILSSLPQNERFQPSHHQVSSQLAHYANLSSHLDILLAQARSISSSGTNVADGQRHGNTAGSVRTAETTEDQNGNNSRTTSETKTEDNNDGGKSYFR